MSKSFFSLLQASCVLLYVAGNYEMSDPMDTSSCTNLHYFCHILSVTNDDAFMPSEQKFNKSLVFLLF